jgi:enoyl-CoA hydratase/carnithine racemase
MSVSHQPDAPVVKTELRGSITTIELNRPHLLNSLNLEMVRGIRDALEMAETADPCRCVLLSGAGDRAFCAGGDIKALAEWVKEGNFDAAEQFFREEYALDHRIHRYPKPVVLVADGIAMGGGLGLAAGADVILATEKTRMAMPETNIGFFPDVGATRWLHAKCQKGYPEYMGLTGSEAKGEESVRCGLATHFVESGKIGGVIQELTSLPVAGDRPKAAAAIRAQIEQHGVKKIPAKPAFDRWVKEHFSGKNSLQAIFTALQNAQSETALSRDVLRTLSERSPTALAVTFALLSMNQGRSLEEVFDTELKAARFMIQHPDYLEGVRARILDKDNQPRWNPSKVEDVEDIKEVFDSRRGGVNPRP